jgi:hypothetical protein
VFSRAISLGVPVTMALALVGRPASADPSTTSIEQGYDLGTIQSPREMAFGGAQTALGTSTTALYNNPANLPLASVYHFEGLAAFSPEARRQSYGGAVVDSSTSKLAGGLAGTLNALDPDGIHRTWTDVRLGLAYPLGDRFSVGTTLRYLRGNQGVTTGPLGGTTGPLTALTGTNDLASDGQAGGPIVNVMTFDAGMTIIPADGFRIGAVGHNLTNPGNGLAPTTFQGGLGYTADLFSLEGDAMADFTTYKSTAGRYMAGGELFLGGHVPLRVGYRYDDGTRTHSLSGGLGYIATQWSFEASVRQDVVSEHPNTMIGVSLRFFYNATGSGGSVDTSNEAF